MSQEPSSSEVTAFATVGTVTCVQQLIATLMGSLAGADADVVAEESMALVAVVTSRSLRERAEAASALLELPLTYRDYVVGGAMLDGDADQIAETEGASYDRIARKLSFYTTHFPEGKLPGPRSLKDKMELWMGRLSPPGLPEPPQKRLEKLGLVGLVEKHVRLVRAFAERG